MFHQVEGLAIDKDISMANLKWVLEEFVKAYFEVDDVELRFRASASPSPTFGRGGHSMFMGRWSVESGRGR